MTPAQKALYWREWGACRKWFLEHRYDTQEADAQRHRIHIEACGTDVSSKRLTNAQFDAILSMFRAYTSSAENALGDQLKIIDQPIKRLIAFRDRAVRLAIDLGIESHGIDAYLDTMAKRRYGRAWRDTRETEAAGICGILTARLKAKRAGTSADV